MTVVLSYVKQQPARAFMRYSCALPKKKNKNKTKEDLFINLLGKGLTQEINGDRSSIWWAPGGNKLCTIKCLMRRFCGIILLTIAKGMS